MATYRTGNHWGVTIVRETPQHYGGFHAELAAVVVDGNAELAERICALLNADERRGGMWCETCEREIQPGDTYAFAPGTGGLVHCGEHASDLGELRVREKPEVTP